MECLCTQRARVYNLVTFCRILKLLESFWTNRELVQKLLVSHIKHINDTTVWTYIETVLLNSSLRVTTQRQCYFLSLKPDLCSSRPSSFLTVEGRKHDRSQLEGNSLLYFTGETKTSSNELTDLNARAP